MAETKAYRPPEHSSVAEKTGRDWGAWFDMLDAWGGQTATHKETARYLAENFPISAWWAQTITVEYERSHGKRQVGETCKGVIEVGVSRRIAADFETIWRLLTTAEGHNQWFTTNAQIDFRVGGMYRNGDGDWGEFTLIRPRRFGFTWNSLHHEPGSKVFVDVNEVGPGKVAVVLTHTKLKSMQEREDLKEGWSWALDSLKSVAETGCKITFEAWKEAKKR